jgi:transcriptional regulator with PAS, ATPase and Fis domain
VLQNRSITKAGDTKSVPIDIRLICATNRDLKAMVREGSFREDLYYRINMVPLHLPPLRERPDEIISLAERFVKEFAAEYPRKAQSLSDEAKQLLLSRRWSGNIRELRGCIEKAVIYSETELIRVEDLRISDMELVDENLVSMDDYEEKMIREALKKCNGNLTLVSKVLKMSRPTLYSRLKKYGI